MEECGKMPHKTVYLNGKIWKNNLKIYLYLLKCNVYIANGMENPFCIKLINLLSKRTMV